MLPALSRAILLLLLARLLAGLATLLLLAGLGLLTGLIALLLLAGVLVGVLVLTHCYFLPTLVFGRSPPEQQDNARTPIPFRFAADGKIVGTLCSHASSHSERTRTTNEGPIMGRYLLLWLLGIPIPILVLIWLFGGLH